MINSYKDLTVWQKSVDLVEKIYKLTQKFPREETYGLTSQMRRAAVSIPSNIAEGNCRGTRRDYAQFLRIAYGSTAELQTQLEVAKRLCFLGDLEYNEVEALIIEIRKMLQAIITKLTPKTTNT